MIKFIRKNMKLKIAILVIAILIACILFILYNKSTAVETVITNGEVDELWEDKLYIPTMIKKEGDTYFIIDCWNSRILYSDVISNDISRWKTLANDNYLGGHTVASDGELYVFDNTDMQQLLVYIKDEYGKFILKQTIENIELRPHYVLYNESNKIFYVIGSINGTLYQFINNNGSLELVDKTILHEIEDSYVRSISIIDNKLYTVSGPGKIYKYDLDNLLVEDEYNVPDELYGMNQIIKIDNTFLITINTNKEGQVEFSTIISTDDLSKLETGEYDDLYEMMGFVGQPYFITYFDSKYWITEISENRGNGIKSFAFEDGKIGNVQIFCYWDNAIAASKERWNNQKNLYAGEMVDLFIFAGQSNMSGKGDYKQAPKVEKGYEFRAITDVTKLYTIEEPFGIYENKEDAINDTTDTGEYRKLRWNGIIICKCIL